MSQGGSIDAIRDWANSYFYNNDQIADFFIKADLGLKAYKLTIIHTPSTEIDITEGAITDPQSYTITTDENGLYTDIFFFHSGETIYLNDGSGSAVSYTLSSYEDVIELTTPIIATPIMTSNTTPSGVCRASSVYTQSGSSANWQPWVAFKQSPDLNGWAPLNNRKVGEWMEYEFTTRVPIVKFELFNRTWTGDDNASPSRIKLQASNDGSNYIDFGEYVITHVNIPSASIVHNLKNITPYKIYRVLITEANNLRSYVAIGCLNLYKPDTSS